MTEPRPEPITATVKQFRVISGLGHTSIYELIKSGELQSVTIGRRRLIVLASYRELLRSRLAAADCHEPVSVDGADDGSSQKMAGNLLENNHR